MLMRLDNLIIGTKEEIKTTYKSMLRNGIDKDILYPNTYDMPDFRQKRTYAIYIDKSIDTFYLLNTTELTNHLLLGYFNINYFLQKPIF